MCVPSFEEMVVGERVLGLGLVVPVSQHGIVAAYEQLAYASNAFQLHASTHYVA